MKNNGKLDVSVKGKNLKKEKKKKKPVKKEDWIAKTRREKRTAAQIRWRSVSRLLFEDVL